MPKKLTIEFIRKEFKKEGYTLLTKNYINNTQKLKYICYAGHVGKICFSSWEQGHRCSECAGLKKLTITFIRKQFGKEGYILLSDVYVNSKTLLEYICPKKHRWFISWNNWKHGHRCPRCSKGGENNSNYNPSLTDKDRNSGRFVFGYKEWKYEVKEKDNFTCQVCGDNKGGNLVSHHLDSYHNNPGLRIAPDNGVCLCEKCHKAFHHKYGYGNNTRKQFEKFRNVLWHIFCTYINMSGDKYDQA